MEEKISNYDETVARDVQKVLQGEQVYTQVLRPQWTIQGKWGWYGTEADFYRLIGQIWSPKMLKTPLAERLVDPVDPIFQGTSITVEFIGSSCRLDMSNPLHEFISKCMQSRSKIESEIKTNQDNSP